MILIFWVFLLEMAKIEDSSGHPRTDNCVLRHSHVTCYKHLLLEELGGDVKTLELREIDGDVIEIDAILVKFPDIENILIYGGNITRFIKPTKKNKIKVLELKHVGVENMARTFLNNFPNLETLNLEGNYLQSLRANFSSGNLKQLYLADNRWNCSLDLDWVHNLNQTVVKDLQNLTCFGEPHGGKPLLVIAHIMKDIKKQCPAVCSCCLPKVVRNPESDRLEPIVEVNCSYRGLTELPPNLPKKTKILRLEGNEIEDIKALKDDPVYRKILDLYLDNNKVRAIEVLEGSYWLRHFRVFSLSGNKLSEVPTYALDNALEQNTNMPNAVRIYLGGNPWRCDCVFTPVFQKMLQKFSPQVQDISEVKCSYVEGDENSLLPIIELSRSSVCRSPTEYSVQALDLLNGVLASLIILVLGKLAYDYYYFKKTGRLPWIVTKMP